MPPLCYAVEAGRAKMGRQGSWKVATCIVVGHRQMHKKPKRAKCHQNHPLHQPIHEILMSFGWLGKFFKKKSTVVGGKLHQGFLANGKVRASEPDKAGGPRLVCPVKGQVAWRERYPWSVVSLKKMVVEILTVLGACWLLQFRTSKWWNLWEVLFGNCLFGGRFIFITFSERWDRGLYRKSCIFAAKQSQGNWESSEQSNTSREVCFGWCSAFWYGNDSYVPFFAT